MSEQEKGSVNQVAGGQDIQQLQLTLKQTMKENKSFQSKINKLQNKYVQLFKQHKLLKQDRQNLISFVLKWSIDSQGKPLYQEPIIGQCNIVELQTIAEKKQSLPKIKIQQLESIIQKNEENFKKEVEKSIKDGIQKLNIQWQNRLKNLKQLQNKELHSNQRQIESLKKSNEIKINQLSQIKTLLQSRTQQLSKISKQKLKIEHHLNNIRKKQISQEISPPEEQNQNKTLIDKNQYLSLKQQIENLMSKRDELKRELKKKQEELINERRINQKMENEITKLKNFQQQCNQKYELVRQCSLEDLQNMILNFHASSDLTISSPIKEGKNSFDAKENNTGLMAETKQQEIQKEYLKNMVIRYINAQTSENFEQAFTLLQIIGRLVKIDSQSKQALQKYKQKRKPWWYIQL